VPALALALALVAATFAAHLPAIFAGYIWDDDACLHKNPLIAAPDGLYKFWFTTQALDYWPLTSTMLWIEWRIWGDSPSPYHTANIVLHALSAVVLWRILKRIGINNLGAFLGGLLFAIHPVTVASTAWIAERKNVLSMALYLFSILAFLRFEDQGERKWYLLALLAAAAALLAKTSVVALPIVLLLLIWWRHHAIGKRDILHTLPFIMLSLVLGLATLWFQHHNSIGGVIVRPEGLASRIASVGWVFWFYLYKIVLPINLAAIYPRWDIDGSRVVSFAPLALSIVSFAVLWHYRKSWGRGPLLALGSFAIMLAPVLGLLTMSYSNFSLVADHLQYPGMPGLMALIGGGMGAARLWSRKKGNRNYATGVTCAICIIVLALAVLTFQQARIYRNGIAFWSHAIAMNGHSAVAYNHRGNEYSDLRDFTHAIEDYTKAIDLSPNYELAYNNRGAAYDFIQDYPRAMSDYGKAIELKPGYPNPYNNLAVINYRLKRYDQAWANVTKCKQLGGQVHPDFIEALTEASGRAQ
jgi:tetratricopeptide (TPR) repeat protein